VRTPEAEEDRHFGVPNLVSSWFLPSCSQQHSRSWQFPTLSFQFVCSIFLDSLEDEGGVTPLPPPLCQNHGRATPRTNKLLTCILLSSRADGWRGVEWKEGKGSFSTDSTSCPGVVGMACVGNKQGTTKQERDPEKEVDRHPTRARTPQEMASSGGVWWRGMGSSRVAR